MDGWKRNDRIKMDAQQETIKKTFMHVELDKWVFSVNGSVDSNPGRFQSWDEMTSAGAGAAKSTSVATWNQMPESDPRPSVPAVFPGADVVDPVPGASGKILLDDIHADHSRIAVANHGYFGMGPECIVA